MKIAIKNIAGKNQGELEVKFPLVEDGKGTQAVHDAVVAYQAAQRSGTAYTKTSAKSPARTRSRGGRKAPAAPAPVRSNRRCGSVVAWSSVPGRAISARSFQENPRARVAQGLSERLKAGDVVVVDDLKLASPKTKDFVGVMSALELKGTTLIVSTGDGQEPDAGLAQRCQTWR